MADFGAAITRPEIRLVDWAAMPTDWYQQAGEAAQEMDVSDDYGAFDRGVDLMQAMLAAGTMATGKRLEDAGFETVGKWLFSTPQEMYERNIEAAMQMQRKRLEESEGLSDAASWFVETAKEQGPMMAIPIAAGITGSAILGRVARGMSFLPHPMAKSLGFMGGAFLASYSLQLGEAYSSMIEEGGKISHVEAHKAAMLAASLDVITPTFIFGRLPIIGPALARKFKRHTAKSIFSGSEIGKKSLFVALALISEGGTEGLQEAIIENAVNFVNGLNRWEYTKEQWEQIREAAYAGGAMGGGIAIVTPRGTRPKPEEPTPEPEAEAAIEEAAAEEELLLFGAPAAPIFTGFTGRAAGLDPTVDYEVAPGRRGYQRAEVEPSPTIRNLRDVLERRRAQLEAGAVPTVTEPTVRTARPQLTPSETAALSLPATRQRRTLPKKVPPITKPIPDGSPSLDLNTGVDARVGRTYDTATRRPLSREQRQQAQKDMDDLVSRQRKEEADARKDDSEVEKLTVASASNEASSDFETWTDEGLTEESRIALFKEKARSILRATNEKVAAAYRSTFAKRLGEYRKLAAGIAITGERGPARGGPKPREKAKPREGEVTRPARGRLISGMAVTNEAIPGMTIEETPDGLWNLQRGDEVLGVYESAHGANRRGRTLTQTQYDRRLAQITKEKEVAEEPTVKEAPPTQVEKDETKAAAAAKKQAAIDKRAAKAAAKQEAAAKKKAAADEEAARVAAAKEKEETLVEREEEIVEKAVKDERTVPQIVKDIGYTAQYKTLSKDGKAEVKQVVEKSTLVAEELDAEVSAEIDSIIAFEIEEALVVEVEVAEEGADLMDTLRAQVEGEDVTGARETVAAIKEEGNKKDITEANRILADLIKDETSREELMALGPDITKAQAARLAKLDKEIIEEAKGKVPTSPQVVLALSPEAFLKNVDNTKSKGGYDMAQLRKVAVAAGIDPKLDRPQMVERLKLWYAEQNNPKDTLTAEELNRITGEGIEISENDEFLDMRFDASESYRRRIPLTEPSQVKGALVSELRRIFGDEAARNMQSLGFINFITFAEARKIRGNKPTPRELSAFVSRGDGQTYFILDSIANANRDSNDMKGLILHEIGVHFGKNILTHAEWVNVKKALLDLYVRGDLKVVKAMNRAAESLNLAKPSDILLARKAFPKAKPLTEDIQFDDLFEEGLAYFATQNPQDIRTGPSKALWETIQQKVRIFFKNLLLAFNPSFKGKGADITSKDIAWLISHLTMSVPDLALSRFGDTRRNQKMRDEKLNRFLEGSVVKDKQYHGTIGNFSFPVFELMELGMHVGTLEQALHKANVKRSSFKEELTKQRASAFPSEEWAGQTLPPENVNSYYINLKNPLVINRDIGQWDKINPWLNHTLNFENSIPDNVSPLASRRWQSFIEKYKNSYDRIAYNRPEDTKVEDMPEIIELEAEFSTEFKKFWRAQDFDGIQYINAYEGGGGNSYIVFSDTQISSTSVYSFKPWRKGLGFMNAIGGTEAENVAGNKKAADFADDTVKGTYEGKAKARTAWHAIRRFFEPLSMVPGSRELLIRRYQARGETTLGENIAKNVYDIFSQATEQEKTIIYKYLTTKDASPNAIPDRQISYATRETIIRGRKPRETGRQAAKASLRDTAVDVKENIHELGQKLVDLKLLSETRFTKLEEAYLPKMYLRYLLGDEYKRSLGAGMKPGPMDYVKARKLHEEWVADLLYGEIKDPEFLASRYISQVTQDIAIVEYLNFIVSDPGNHGWVLPNGTATFKGNKVSVYWLESEGDFLLNTAAVKEVTDPEIAKEMRQLSKEMKEIARTAEPGIAAYDAKRYSQIPKHPKFGAMGGIYVLKEIYQDVMGIAGPGGEQATVAKFFTSAGLGGKTQQVFKYTRVIANPPTLMRNIFSNMVLLHTSGVSMFRIPGRLTQAMSEIVNDGEYYKMAQRYGIEIGTFTSEEIRRIDLEYTAIKKNKGLTDQIKLFVGKVSGPGSRFYQKSEVLFKLAKLIDGMESKGLSEGEAALEAQEAILDYSLVSPSIRWLRSVPFGAPFITFQIKVLPQLIKNLRKHPMAFAPYVALPYIMAQIFAAENDVDEEDLDKLKKHMGDWARDRGSIYFLPSRGDDGKWRAVDIGYMLPWTAWWETARDMYKTEFGEAWQETGLFSGPIDVLKGLESNVDPFTQQPIWNDLDPPQQQYFDIMQFMASYMVPPFMSPRNKAGAITTGGGPLIKIMMAAGLKEGNIGEDGLPKYDIPWSIMAMFGFNTYTMNPQQQLHQNLRWMTVDLQKTQRRMIQLMTEPGISDEKRKELAHEYVVHIQNKTAEIQEYVESVKGMSEKLK